jgi:nucleoside-diphosphate-sugar epimerase
MSFQSRLAGKKILITGASGFIGSHLYPQLDKKGGEIHAVSRSQQKNENNGIHWWLGDLANIDTVRVLFRSIKPDYVFHLASYVKGARDLTNVMPTFRSNLISQVNLMTVASEEGCERFITLGSMEEPDIDSSRVVPSSPYSASKWAASAYSRMFHALYEFPVVILRVFMVYGPAQKDISKLIPYVILTLLKGENPKLSSGHRKVDWIYVNDVIDGILAVAEAPNIEGMTIDIGSGKLVSVQSVVQNLVDKIDPNIKPIFGVLQDRQMEHEIAADLNSTNKSIGWNPKISLDDGLIYTVAWFKENLKKWGLC